MPLVVNGIILPVVKSTVNVFGYNILFKRSDHPVIITDKNSSELFCQDKFSGKGVPDNLVKACNI